MKVYQRFMSILVLSVLLLFSGLMASAQDQGQEQNYSDQSAAPGQSVDTPANNVPDTSSAPAEDAPERAARLQYMSGSVSVQPQGTGEWVAGQLNRPLTNADNVWADKNSKAEISVGTGLIRLDSETSLTLSNIGENVVQLSLHQGAMNLHVRRLYDNETYEVDTPNQAFTILKPGDYRFDVDSDADKTIITVWRGEGDSSANGQTVKIRENQQARFGEGTFSADDIHAAPAPDSFDEWARGRDEKLDHSASARYVSPDVVGYEDLDEYGNWKQSDQYGNVWVPNNVPAGWAPYSYGNWIWQSPWGWTWVDSDPWGYAPFHYGRWVYWGGSWGWAPGPIWARPYYAPALVTWFGGPGWGVSFGFGGGFGWCPLGWGEPFIPWYHASFGYFRGVNITNTHITNVNITNIYNNNFINGRPRPGNGIVGAHNGTQLRYANMRAPGGFTAVSRNTLVNSMPVARNRLSVSPNQLSRATPLRDGLAGVRPTRTSMLGGNFRHAAAPPPHAFSRPMVSRGASPTNRGNTGFRAMGNARPENTAVRGTTPSNQAGFGGRPVPHPPSATGFGNRDGMRSGAPMESARSAAPTTRPQSVPRPPSASMPRGGEPSFGGQRGNSAPQTSGPRGGARPETSAPRASESGSRGNTPRSTGPRSEMTVPRPPNSTNPRGYSAGAERGSYSSPRSEPTYQANNRSDRGGSYGRQEPSYGRPTPNYGGGAYGSRPAPSYDRGSYGRSTPSYGGGGYYGRPTPSYGGGSYGSSVPSYGGGRSASGGGRMPSYGGGGGGRSYGGGSVGGGGGHASGGGGHSGGGEHSSGGSGHGSHR